MNNIQKVAEHLKKDFPNYHFPICRGLFEKYIAVDIHGKIAFTIWVDNNSGSAALLDEVDLFHRNWLKKRLKTQVFHWSRQRNQWRTDYTLVMLEKMELHLPERKLIRKRLEHSLQHIHIT